MKKSSFLLPALLLLFSLQCFGQYGIAYYRQAELMEKQADDMRATHPGKKAERIKIADSYVATADKFQEASKQLSSLRTRSTFAAHRNLVKAAEMYYAAKDFQKAAEMVNRYLQLWPDNRAIDFKKLWPKRFHENGVTYGMDTAASFIQWYRQYYMGRSIASEVFYAQKEYDKTRQYANEVYENSKTIPDIRWKPTFYLATLLYKDKKNCEAATYAIQSLQAAAKTEADADSVVQHRYDYFAEQNIRYIQDAGQDCLKPKQYQDAVVALAKMNEMGWAEHSQEAMKFAQAAEKDNTASREYLAAMVRHAQQLNDDKAKTDYLARLDAFTGRSSYEVLRDVEQLYAGMGLTEKQVQASKKAQRKLAWDNTHFGLSTNPYNLIIGQYLGVFDLMLPYTTHELRINYVSKGSQVLLADEFNLQNPTDYIQSLKYKGYQISYTYKPTRKNDPLVNTYMYLGPQFRYTHRDYDPIRSNLVYPDNTGFSDTVSVKGVSNAYDVCIIAGQQQRRSWWYMEVYGGLGIGYKTLETNQTLRIHDPRFAPGRWNNFYVPFRLGIRVGVMIK